MLLIEGSVTLSCDGCGAERSYSGDAEVEGQQVVRWWLLVRGERCAACYVQGLSDPGEQAVKVRRDANDTSRKAAWEAMPRTGTQRYRVLGLIARSDGGMTDEEVRQEMNIYWTSGGTDTRRLELVEGKWVEDSGQRRKTRSNKDAAVWVLTDRGRTALRGHTFDLPD